MPFGKRKPLISSKSVESALGLLRYSAKTSESAQPLLYLTLVDEVLMDPMRPNAESLREYSLSKLLSNIITQQWRAHRALHGIVSEIRAPSRQDAPLLISQDAHTESIDVIGWSYLYHYYTCSTLNISAEEFSEWSSFNARTIRRHRSHAISKLTSQLIKMEWEAGLRHQRQRLHAAIPPLSAVSLAGRANAQKTLLSSLTSNKQAVIQITGREGIGKTELVVHSLSTLVDQSDWLQQIKWCRQPQSLTKILRYLRQELIPRKAPYSLREAMSLMRTIIVLDDCSESFVEAMLPEEWDIIRHGSVIITSREYHPLAGNVHHIHLSELDRPSTEQIVLAAHAQNGMSAPSRDELAWYWQHIGGNPRALRTAVGYVARKNSSHVEIKALGTIYDDTYAQMDPSDVKFILLLCLAFPESVDLQVATEILGEQELKRSLEKTEQIFLTQTDVQEDTSTISRSWFNYIQLHFHQDESLTTPFTSIVDKLCGFEIAFSDKTSALLAEWILDADWIGLDRQTQQKIVHQQHSAALCSERHSAWYELWTRKPWLLGENNAQTRLAFAQCARRVGDYSTSEYQLSRIIADTGQTGDFALQTQARLEVAINARLIGDYASALSTLDAVMKFAVRNREEKLYQTTLLEYAQIAIDRADLSQLVNILDDLTLENQSAILIRAEAALMKGDFVQAREYATASLDFSNNHVGIAHTLIGRSFSAEGKHEGAVDWLNLALQKADRQADLLAFARGQTNLAAALISIGRFDEARQLLVDALKLQTRINDRVGLQATQHNLYILKAQVE